MTHRTVETLIGRLVADEGLRALFRNNPRAVVAKLRRAGAELNETEADALASLDPDALARLAKTLDARLQRASLTPRTRTRGGPALLYVLLALGSAAAHAAPPEEKPALPWTEAMRRWTPPLSGLALPWAPRAEDANAARSAAPASTFGWHRAAGPREEPLGLLVFPMRGAQRGAP